MRFFCTAKIHNATITGANVDYSGSIRIDKNILEIAGISEYEMVHINCKDTGQHWETYVIPGDIGEFTLHGAPANLFKIGQKVVVNRIEGLDIFKNQTVLILEDKTNAIKEVK